MGSAQSTMAPKAKAGAMKAAAMKGAAAMSKSALVNALIEGTEIKGSACKQLLDNLAAVATKAGKKEVFGKVVMVKAKPASKVVKAYCVADLKKSIWAASWRRCSSG